MPIPRQENGVWPSGTRRGEPATRELHPKRRNESKRYRQSVAMVAVLLIGAQGAFAYDYPLQSEELREAYFLGERNNPETVSYLLRCVQDITTQQKGPYIVSQIAVATPYQQIVLRGQQDVPGDSPVEAETDLQQHPLDFVLRVRMEWNSTYLGDAEPVTAQDFEHEFSVRVSQRKKITPSRTEYVPIYGKHGPAGEIIELHFDPAKIRSATMQILVKSTDGQSEKTEFDLTKIK